jgi:uracil-DNA glycosylase
MVQIGNNWDKLLQEQFESAYYQELRAFLKYEYANGTVYPDMYDIFNAFKATDFHAVKAVILGQDPYHGAGQAHGMCFSVKKGVAVPPSLQNIFKEIRSDLGDPNVPFPINTNGNISNTVNNTDNNVRFSARFTAPHGNLENWAKSGVLLLNTVLTVRAGAANSHRGHGWETFTSAVIELLNNREQPIVFLLWGSPARQKKALITNPRHLVLEAAHPSPLSAYNGFFGCKHFSKANNFLTANGSSPIDWRIE